MKNASFTLESLSQPKKAAAKSVVAAKSRTSRMRTVKPLPAKKSTKHGRETVRLLERLRDEFTWDFEAMKRV